MQKFDVIVIGGGSAGTNAAQIAAQAGARVALIERSGRYGGTCRYVGCIPSKVLLHIAQTLHVMRTADRLGLPAIDPQWDWQRVKQHKDDIIRRAGGDDGYGAPRDFYDHGGQTFTGSARFRAAHTIEVGDDVLHAEKIIVATGSRPRLPKTQGLDQAGVQTWETIFDLPKFPSSMLIIGGGPLGVEFSQMFRRFGSDVTVLETTDDILPQADPQATQALRAVLEAEGVKFQCGIEIRSIERHGDTRIVTICAGDREETLHAAEVLVAVGPQPNTEDLNLEAAGVKLNDKGALEVDDQLRTSVPHIYACGDVATKYNFTHIASYESQIAAHNAVYNTNTTIDERVVPWAVYTEPSLAQVGLTEQQAREQQIEIVSAALPIREVERSLLVEQQQGLIKAIARKNNGELLGVSIVAARADDLIHEAALAVRLRLSVRAIAGTIHAYPTFSQGLQQVMDQIASQID